MVIHLVLKYQWFDQIASKMKYEEYRDIKPYYEGLKDLKRGDIIIFHRGYTKKIVKAEVKYCYKGFGVKSWGGNPDILQWVIGIHII